MMELVFVVCLATAPADCREETLMFAGITPFTCMIGAQAQLAEWTNRNPGHEISGWKCRWRRTGEHEV